VNEPQDKDQFLQQVTSTLEQSANELDDATLRELRRRRHEALAASEKRVTWLLPVGGLAMAATVAAFSVSLWMAAPQPGVETLPAAEDMALLGDAEALEFYEDLDFYLWLDEENEAG
jgi:hypothetical protein